MLCALSFPDVVNAGHAKILAIDRLEIDFGAGRLSPIARLAKLRYGQNATMCFHGELPGPPADLFHASVVVRPFAVEGFTCPNLGETKLHWHEFAFTV